MFFLINVALSIIDVYDAYAGNLPSSSIVSNFLYNLSNSLSMYGGVVALMIGFSSMNDEFTGKALNTLLVKPVYRDTIINGKMIGCTCFMICVFFLTGTLYISMLTCVCGSVLFSSLPVLIPRLPLIFLFTLLSAMIFFSIAVLLRILVKDSTASLLLTILVFIFLTVLMPNAVFTQQIGTLVGLSSQDSLGLIAGLSPSWAEMQVGGEGLFSPNVSLAQAIGNCWTEFAKLFVIMGIITLSGYIVFLKRDVA